MKGAVIADHSVRVRTAGLVEAATDIGARAGDAPIIGDQCVAGMEERSGDVHCMDPERAGLSYWIAVDYAGPDGVLRLAPLDQELRLGVMVSMIGAPIFILIAARTRGMGR